MYNRILRLIALLLVFVPAGVRAACSPAFVVPFDMVGSYVVVTAKVNSSTPLKLIFDTGVRYTIITELLSDDSLSVNFKGSRELLGLGAESKLMAYISDSNTISINRKLKLKNRVVYVLQEDIFNLTRQTGTKINGLIGADVLQDYIVQIDYQSHKLKFYDKIKFCVPKGYGEMPMTVERQKMYIHLSVLETDSARRRIKMLIDTGAELGAWFQTLTNNAVNIPEKSVRGRIGQGLSGEVAGYYARVPQICISNFCVRNPIVAFPDSATISEIVRYSDRDGTIGSQLLSRFNIIIDIFNQKFYFKPNSNFSKPFVYNVAGIEVAQVLAFIPQVEVINVWKGSPADNAGIKPGDIIEGINFEKTFGMTLSQIRAFFERPSKRKLKVFLRRNADTFRAELDMNARI